MEISTNDLITKFFIKYELKIILNGQKIIYTYISTIKFFPELAIGNSLFPLYTNILCLSKTFIVQISKYFRRENFFNQKIFFRLSV